MKKIIIITFSIIAFLPVKEICGQWTHSTNIVWTDDQVGINVATPQTRTNLHIADTFINDGGSYGIYNKVKIDRTTAVADLYTNTTFANLWSNNADLYSLRGYIGGLTTLKNTSGSQTSLAIGSMGFVSMTDPIPSANLTIGTYGIYGMYAQISGSITNYPTTGNISALYARDAVQGSQTWAGYFEGKTHFEDSVGIGTKVFDGYILAVAGKIRATEVKIESLPWSDFVFKEDYNLMSLSSLKEYIQENQHLPDIPSEEEVQKDGISLGEMDALLLQKIEELTLYLIEIKEENESLKTDIKALKTEQKKLISTK